MTTRRLSIDVVYTPLNDSDKSYSESIKRHEIPRGIPISVIYYITNMDSQSYSVSNGKISTTLIEPLSGKPFAISEEKPKALGDLPPLKKIALYNTIIRMPFEGNAEFECTLKPYNEEEEIDYFTNNESQLLGKESWTQPFKVISREQLEIIELLKEIRDNTKKLLNKS